MNPRPDLHRRPETQPPPPNGGPPPVHADALFKVGLPPGVAQDLSQAYVQMLVTSEQALATRQKTQSLVAQGLMPMRIINPKTVEQYRRAMRSGFWGRCDQGVTIGIDGGAYNGNHRYEALSKEPGLAFNFYVRLETPLDEALEIARNCDQGRARGIAAKLEMDRSMDHPDIPPGEAKGRGEVFRCFEDIFYANPGQKLGKDFREIKKFILDPLVAEPFSALWAIRQAAEIVERKARGRLKGAVPLSAFLLNYPTDPELTSEYYGQFLNASTSNGDDVGIKSPIGILRAFFESKSISTAASRPTGLRLATLVIYRLMNGYYQKREVKRPRAKDIDTEGRRVTFLLFEHFRPAFPVALLPVNPDTD